MRCTKEGEADKGGGRKMKLPGLIRPVQVDNDGEIAAARAHE